MIPRAWASLLTEILDRHPKSESRQAVIVNESQVSGLKSKVRGRNLNPDGRLARPDDLRLETGYRLPE